MAELLFRTEDLTPEEIGSLFVETELDRRVVDALKSRQPVVLVGSRGVGKSFLLKIAASELKTAFDEDRVLPVYVSLIKSSLLATDEEPKLKAWILSRIAGAIIRAAKKAGLLDKPSAALSMLAGGKPNISLATTRIEQLAESLEQGWKGGGEQPDLSIVPSVEEFKDAVGDLCDDLSLPRVAVFIDEAAHVLIPEQQRVFFTLFRDLRSPRLTLNAAVYPGVTHYGETFQPIHDAQFLSLDRDIWAPDYVVNMKAMVERQADPTLLKTLRERGQNFSILAYASSGNPRLLLKTISKSPSLSAPEVNSVIREFYRDQIWAEHSQLASVYAGHRGIVDWGRTFVESVVLKALKNRNDEAMQSASPRTALAIWIHRDAPKRSVQALRILQYTGVLKEHALGIKASRSEVGTRYLVNVGCVLSMESNPSQTGFQLIKASDPRRMVEFGSNHEAFQSLINPAPDDEKSSVSEALRQRLAQSVRMLDLTEWQKDKLEEQGFTTVRDVLGATDDQLQGAYYVGPARARKMKNAAETSVLEYLSG
jgi:hypothetical protein